MLGAGLQGVLRVTNSTFTGNQATLLDYGTGGAIAVAGGSIAGLAEDAGGGGGGGGEVERLVLEGVVAEGNRAGRAGGVLVSGGVCTPFTSVHTAPPHPDTDNNNRSTIHLRWTVCPSLVAGTTSSSLKLRCWW